MEFSFKFVDTDALNGDTAAQELLKPKRGSTLASGLDLVAANKSKIVLKKGCFGLVPTGIAIALPAGFEAQVRPRSGLAAKYGVTILNAPGTVDADYRGEVKVILINHSDADFCIERGIRIAQMVIAPVTLAQFEQTIELNDTSRGKAGFGSTGVLA